MEVGWVGGSWVKLRASWIKNSSGYKSNRNLKVKLFLCNLLLPMMGFEMYITFFKLTMFMVCGHLYVHCTSVLQQLCHLVLGSPTNTMKRAQLSQSLHNISVLAVQRSYSEPCHCKVLGEKSTHWSQKKAAKTIQWLSARTQCGVGSALSPARTFPIPHNTCVLWGSGKLK